MFSEFFLMEELRESRCSIWRIARLSQFKLKLNGYQRIENLNSSNDADYEKPMRKCASVQECKSFDSDVDVAVKPTDDTSPRGVLEGLDVALRSPVSDTSSSTASTSSESWHVFLKRWGPKSVKRLYSAGPQFGLTKMLTGKLRFQRAVSCPDPERKSSSCSCRSFSFDELKRATDNFSSENIIGRGGYAEVYKGYLENGQNVAIKRLLNRTSDEDTTNFLSELGVIVHVDHPNTCKLIGFGIEGGLFLVLQLSENGSLSSFLYGTKEKLDWDTRYRIAIETAEGLHYLHEKCPRRIIHRDIKASNILLSQDFEPQISDFGLAKWLPDKLTHYTMSSFEGTFGYLAPEYLMHGTVNEKVDIFAYGVLLLELITGRKAIDSSKQSLVIWAKPLLERKKTAELIDPFLGDAYDSSELSRAANIAYLCIQQSSMLRPRMSQVVRLLKGQEGRPEALKERQRTLQRTYSEELFDAEEYNATRYLNDLTKIKKLAFDF